MRRDYLSRLSCWARWYLTPAEAAEVVEDYRELIEQEPRNEAALRQDIGGPKEAVRQLMVPAAYHRWLTVLGILTACTVLPALMCLNTLYWSPLIYPARSIFLALGIVLSFQWFRREGSREERFPKAIPVFLAVVLVGMAWAGFLAWIVLNKVWIDVFFPPEREPILNIYRGQMIQWSLILSGIAMILISLFGLVKARLGDRRWRAVYVFALTGSLLTLSVYGMLSSISFFDNWQMLYFLRLVFIIAIGLAGTGAALC